MVLFIVVLAENADSVSDCFLMTKTSVSGSDVLPDVCHLRGGPRDAPVRLQHRRHQCTRGQHRELHEGCVQGPVRGGHQRGVYPAALLGGSVHICHRWYARRLQRGLDWQPVWEVRAYPRSLFI